MPRMSKKKRLEMSVFINSKGRIEYNRLCKVCALDCKQSHRTIIIDCPKYTLRPKKPARAVSGSKKFRKLEKHP